MSFPNHVWRSMLRCCLGRSHRPRRSPNLDPWHPWHPWPEAVRGRGRRAEMCWGSPWVSWWKQYLFQYLFRFSPGFAIPPVVFTSLPSHFNSCQFISMMFSSATFDLWILFAMKHHRNCYSKNWWNPQWVFSDVFFQRFFGGSAGSAGTGSQRETSLCSALGPGEGRGHRLGALGGSGACSGARHLRYFRVDTKIDPDWL